MAEDDSSDHCHRCICCIYGQIFRCGAYHADSVLRRKVFRPWMAGNPGPLFCSGRHCKRNKLSVVAIGTNAGIAPITCAVVGALLGFLLFNVYPASVFMGDTGSLALGGFVVSTAYMMQMPLFILIVGLIYLVEVLSVIIQVTYFKKTGGKRIFRMAPIHHHFELGGWSETRVVAVFSITTAILCLIALLAM